MKRFYLQILSLCLCVSAFAQTPILEITTPASIATSLTYGTTPSPAQATATSPSWGYQLKSLADFVAGDVAIAIDSTMTDSTKRLENCTLTGTASNVKGKYALIRRGTCSFSPKALDAVKAGAIGVIIYSQETNASQVINMSAADTASANGVKVPTFSISYVDAQKMVKAITAGTKVSVNYRYSTFYRPSSYYQYATPLKEIISVVPQVSISKYLKPVAPDTVQYRTQLKIVEPDGKAVNFGLAYGIIGTDPNQSDTSARRFNFPVYTPTKIGKYQLSYGNNKNNDILQDSFVVTNYTFSQDNFVPESGAVFEDSISFVKGNLANDAGHFFTTGVGAHKATHGVFSIKNPKSIPVGDVFNVVLYEFNDGNLYNKIYDNPQTLSYSDMTSIGAGTYKMTGKETPDSLLTVEFKTPLTLKDTFTYLLMVQYDGSISGNTTAPAYTIAGRSSGSAYFLTDFLFTYSGTKNQFYTGYTNRYAQVMRLAMAGFKPGTIDTKTIEAWAENQVTVFPNPVAMQLTLNFDLQTLNPTVDYLITSVEGLEMKAGQFKNVQTGTQSVNVSDLANGLYFVRLLGTDGWRTKAFVVTK